MKPLLTTLAAATLLTLLSLTCHAQVTTNGFQNTTFGNLGTVADGKVRYCTDCTAGNPVTGGGSGAYVWRIGGVWVGNTMIPGGGSGGAPTNATYVTQTPNGTLTNEQALSLLSTGLMRSVTSTGVVTIVNTSAGVAANISDESGSGALLFGTNNTQTGSTMITPSVTTTVALNGAVTISSGSAGDLTIANTGNIIVNPSGNSILPTTGYDINLGSLSKKYLTLNAAELWVETLVAQNTLATFGGRVLIAPSNLLVADLTNVATSIDVKYSNFANGDRVYMESNGNVEFMAIISGATPIAGGYRYTVTRNLDGTGANAWSAGDALVDTGTTGSGFIDAYSVSGVKSSSELGPTIVGNIRNSATYNDWNPIWAIGNLSGLYGHSSGVYGVALGRYQSGYSHIDIDDTNGIRIIKDTATVIGQWSTAGVITVGEVGASKDNIQISSGALSIRNNTTERIGMTAAGIMTIKDSAGAAVLTFDAAAGAEITKKLTMPGTNSAIAIGVTPPTSASVGTGIWIDRTGLFGLSGSVVQTTINSTGQILAGAGAVTMNANGLSLAQGTGSPNKIRWTDSGTQVGFVQTSYNSGLKAVQFELAGTAKAADTTGTTTAQFGANNDAASNVAFGAISNGSAAGDFGYAYISAIGQTFAGLTVGGTTLATQTLDVRGRSLSIGVQWVTGSKPACNAGNRGLVWYVAGGAGVLDTFELCRKAADDSYAWVSLF